MRVLVTGAGGMLARALVAELRARGHTALPATRAELDVTDAAATRERLLRDAPDAVVQCAAFTAVDAAEGDEEQAFLVNALGTENVARACAEAGAHLVYPSTDYVFDGRGTEPYPVDAPLAPVNAYGRSKAAGEAAARRAGRWTVVRTSWLYGAGGRNFVDTITLRARERDELQVVDDQVGRPTWTGSLSTTLAELVERTATGIFHATGGGEPVSWYGFAQQVLAAQAIPTRLRPVPSDTFQAPAPRPAYSVLDCSRTEAVVGIPAPHWRDSLRRYLGDRVAEAHAGGHRTSGR